MKMLVRKYEKTVQPGRLQSVCYVNPGRLEIALSRQKHGREVPLENTEALGSGWGCGSLCAPIRRARALSSPGNQAGSVPPAGAAGDSESLLRIYGLE